jgi:hypothetical protein
MELLLYLIFKEHERGIKEDFIPILSGLSPLNIPLFKPGASSLRKGEVRVSIFNDSHPLN